VSSGGRSGKTGQGAAIVVERLTKRYGVHAAVDGISFEVGRGEVVGFLGPNGAGKSTTLRILAGFLGATSGRCLVEGHDVIADPHGARAATGYMPEAVPLYGEMRVREYLRFRAELKGVPRVKRVDFVGRAMELARVTDVADTLIEHLSKGYKQRVGLADALVAKPPLLILDEPTAGMDPNQIREVRALIKELGEEHTVLLSTHILSEVEASCSRVVVISKGRLVGEGAPGELASRVHRAPRLVAQLRGKRDAWKPLVDALPNATLLAEKPLEDGVHRLEIELAEADDEGAPIDHGAAVEGFAASLVKAKVGVRELSIATLSLEELFASLTQDQPAAAPKGKGATP
jgi:ABC-2 type transport system ATP-binding protein